MKLALKYRCGNIIKDFRSKKLSIFTYDQNFSDQQFSNVKNNN